MKEDVPLLLTVEQVCDEVLQISKMQLYRLEKAGKIKSIMIGKKGKRYSVEDTKEFIDASRSHQSSRE